MENLWCFVHFPQQAKFLLTVQSVQDDMVVVVTCGRDDVAKTYGRLIGLMCGR
jgi:hypothetical protein